MLEALFIFVDEEFDSPVYAEPEPIDVDPELWEAVTQTVHDALEGDAETEGTHEVGELVVAWRVLTRNGLSFVAGAREIKPTKLEQYLKMLQRAYFDEVDDVRRPEREGVADVVVDVIPPWEEED